MRAASEAGAGSEDVRLLVRGLEAALDAIGAPAFVAHANGAVSHASASARLLLEHEKRETAACIRHAIRRPGEDVLVTALGARGAGPSYLVVLRDLDRLLEIHLADVVRRWKLTARERDVLRRLVAGELGKVIAGQLRLHPGSVERHVASIYRKSGCATRGRLFAKFWTLM